jgi:Amt family ammonium transporter
MNSLMAMVGGILAALWFGKNDPGFIHNGPLAGLVAVCAGSDVMHPIGSLFVGLIAGWIFVKLFTIMQQTKKIDDVLGVWPLHGVCGAWGGIAVGIFGLESLGGIGGVAFSAQVIGTVAGIVIAIVGGLVVYGILSKVTNIRLTQEEEFIGADLSIHSIGSVNHD